MKIIGVLFLLGVLAALYVWFFVYNKPHRDYETADPDHVVSAEELFDKYRTDKYLADSLYTGMVVQIYGALNKVEFEDSILTAIFVFDQGMFGDEGIRCVMLPNYIEELRKFGPGDKITLKGYCTGYTETDVILQKSSIVKEE